MFKRILLRGDGSAFAEQALPYAVAAAERFGAELILLRVFEPLRGVSGVPRVVIERVQERTRSLAHEYVGHAWLPVFGNRACRCGRSPPEGYPHREIRRFSENNQVDLIVICTRGRAGFSRWLMGSVADRVVCGASIPVLLVRAQEKET